jgi:hypothetical protein
LLAWFGQAQGWASLVAVALVATAWLWVALRSAQTRRRPARSTLLVLGLATLLLVAALAWPLFEGQLIALLRS